MATPSLLSRVIESQWQDAEIVSIRDRVQSGTGDEGWTIHADGSLRYRGRVVVPQLTDLREEILREFHCSRFAFHPGGTKMYQDLRRQYYWSGMKRHVGDFVRRCLTCNNIEDKVNRKSYNYKRRCSPSFHFILSSCSFLTFTAMTMKLLLFFIFFPFSGFFSGAKQCHPSDKTARLKFKYSFANPDQILQSWNPHFDCYDWYGVLCNDTTNRVMNLELSIQLNGTIPDLTYLRTLRLRNYPFLAG